MGKSELENRDDLIRFAETPDEVAWDIDVDVLVVGAGGCGLVAALAAAQRGAQVFVVEKEKKAGGNTALSQAMVPAARSRLQIEAGIEDSPEIMAEDVLAKNHHEGDPGLTLHIARESGALIDWLMDEVGIGFQLISNFLYPGHTRHRIHSNLTCKGEHLVTHLVQAAAGFPSLDIAYNAPVRRLVASPVDSAVWGAEVEIEGVGRNLARAKKTILALNGFGANRLMLQKYIPEMSEAYYFGHEGNTGEGILWGEALGAQLENMGAYQAHGSVTTPHGTLLTWAAISHGGYQVNTAGERFVNEYHGYSEHALDVLRQEGGQAVEIFDQRIFDAVSGYEDFQKCLQMGAVKKFESIRGLAAGFGLPVDSLLRTHESFQQAARGESGDAWGRRDFGPPLGPPYFGVRVTGALFHTQGGLKVNGHGQVARGDGSLIPNLYAGGGTAAGFSGRSGPQGYLSANGLMAALILGKLAGEHASGSVRH